MKEILNQDIRSIEDREMRWLVRYEQLVAWHRAGGLSKGIEMQQERISAAEMRISQIEALGAAAAQFDARAVRNAQMADVAARHRAEAAERQTIIDAVNEVLALEEIVPAEDIDDILSEVSSALGIELPTEADKADICQRRHKSIEELKKELGPSLWDQRMVDHKHKATDKFEELVKSDRLARLIQTFASSVAHHQMMKEYNASNDILMSSYDDMIWCRNYLYDQVTDLAKPPLEPVELLDDCSAAVPGPSANKAMEISAPIARRDTGSNSRVQKIKNNILSAASSQLTEMFDIQLISACDTWCLIQITHYPTGAGTLFFVGEGPALDDAVSKVPRDRHDKLVAVVRTDSWMIESYHVAHNHIPWVHRKNCNAIELMTPDWTPVFTASRIYAGVSFDEDMVAA